MAHHPQITTWAAAAGAATLLLTTAGPASARPEPQPGPWDNTVRSVSSPTAWTYDNCPLRRLGTQLVRCDNLTGGNGSTAPTWVPGLTTW